MNATHQGKKKEDKLHYQHYFQQIWGDGDISERIYDHKNTEHNDGCDRYNLEDVFFDRIVAPGI
jgi:hypothetical protein